MSNTKVFAKLGDFEIRSITYLDGHTDDTNYDIVKWENHEPLEVIDWETKERKVITKSCYSIGRLDWNEKEEAFEFKSIGLRFLRETNDELNKFILKFAKEEEKRRQLDN